jgi:hypothetical protein
MLRSDSSPPRPECNLGRLRTHMDQQRVSYREPLPMAVYVGGGTAWGMTNPGGGGIT